MSGFNIGDSRVIESREVSDGVAIRRQTIYAQDFIHG